ncbi:MAG: rRNA pseudouridine synthase [Bdellovibrionales bacterium]|nr:rRNA pseudouridine synthase [Bdellovibrionales bacterium]
MRPKNSNRKTKTNKAKSPDLVRINKYLADNGISSRRKADELVNEGLVKLNGKTVYELGVRIDPSTDRVTVKGKPLRSTPQEKVYYLFNKPKKVITSMTDPQERLCVGDYFKKLKTRVFPAGRLDWDTEGLLIVTNDGEFTQEVMHPKSEIPKTYIAKIDGLPKQEQLDKLLKGVSIVGGRVKALKIEKIKRGTSDKYSWIKITITEGKNHQVKKMFAKIGFDVMKLQRVAIGKLSLGAVRTGHFKKLEAKDLLRIFKK